VKQLGWLLLAGFAFGLLMAEVKGQAAGVRDAVGNTSAPWVVVPFLAGTRYPQVWRAALIGLATTLAAFLGFYLAEAWILGLGPHPWYVDLQLTLGSGHVFELWGIVSGAVYGALGGIWAARSLAAAPIAVGLAFVCEPLIVLLVTRAGLWGGSGPIQYHWLWLTEVLIGLAGIAYVALRLRAAPTRR
jgi:hypothetical protein